jgi:predicted ATPase
VLLVEGRTGMGKSRLLAEAVEAAARRGFILSRGRADEADKLSPLKPLMSAFGESPQTLSASWDQAPADQRLWLVDTLQARLEERAAQGPHLVTLDDLQWADPTTLLALRALIAELASYPLELAELVAGTGGNPFMLGELLRGPHDEGAVRVTDGCARLVSRQLPRRVQEYARRRLGRLSARTRHLLQVAAVLGRSFDAADIAEMLGEPPSRLLPALDEAEAAGVLVSGAGLPAFRHDLLWRAVTESVTPSIGPGTAPAGRGDAAETWRVGHSRRRP